MTLLGFWMFTYCWPPESKFKVWMLDCLTRVSPVSRTVPNTHRRLNKIWLISEWIKEYLQLELWQQGCSFRNEAEWKQEVRKAHIRRQKRILQTGQYGTVAEEVGEKEGEITLWIAAKRSTEIRNFKYQFWELFLDHKSLWVSDKSYNSTL